MIKFSEKPATSGVFICGFPTTKVNGLWYTLHLNGLGYYGMRIDGRTVMGAARKAKIKLNEQGLQK